MQVEALAELVGRHAAITTLTLACHAVFLVALERVWPSSPRSATSRPDIPIDLACSYLVPLVTFPFYVAFIHALAGALAAWPELDAWRVPISRSSWWAQVPAALVLADVAGYWKHRAFHGRTLWRYHAAHHSSERVDWLSNERFHPFDALAGSVVQAGLLLSLGFAPSVVALTAVVRRSYSMFIHADTRLPFGRMAFVLVSPTTHRWHHSDDVRFRGRNFATMFAFVDLAFGTLALPRGETPRSFGLGPTAERRGAVAWLLEPVRWRRAGPLLP